mgnify:CR=1 FL=1
MKKHVILGTFTILLTCFVFYSCKQPKTRTEYYSNGKLKEITHWIGNKQVGNYETYHENGILANKGQLNCDGCFVGTCYSYYDDGFLMSIEKYNRRGELITFDFWEHDGKQSVKDGTGVAISYHPNGKIRSIMSYEDCHFEGKCEYWHPNGIKGGELFYSDGKPIGVWHFWDENGELYKTENYNLY